MLIFKPRQTRIWESTLNLGSSYIAAGKLLGIKVMGLLIVIALRATELLFLDSSINLQS